MARVKASPAPRAPVVVSGPTRKVRFRYVATSGENRIVRGDVSAVNEVAAQNLLVARGYTPISLVVAPSFFSLEAAFPGMYAVKPREVMTFSRQLATLLEAGMNILSALALLRASASAGFRRVLGTIINDLAIGNTFSAALAKHPKIFNDIYVRSIGIGESTGHMEALLRELANYMEKQAAMSKKLSGALTYPVIVLTVGLGVSFVLITVALPPMGKIFTQMNLDLPLPTKVLLGLSAFLTGSMLYILAVLGTVVLAAAWYLRKPEGKRAVDNLKMKIPLMGAAIQMSELARIGRTASLLLNAGFSLQEITEVLPKTMSTFIYRDAMEKVREGMLLGQGFYQPLAQYRLFPPLFLQMVRVGEESNALEGNFAVLATFYEASSDEKIGTLVSMVGPLSTLILGAFSAFVILSLMMPMYSLSQGFG